jgi:Na+/proline symporter
MKYYNAIFDIFLFESLFAFLFGFILTHLDDPLAKTLLTVALVSFGIAILLGVVGKAFNLFKRIDPASDF